MTLAMLWVARVSPPSLRRVVPSTHWSSGERVVVPGLLFWSGGWEAAATVGLQQLRLAQVLHGRSLTESEVPHPSGLWTGAAGDDWLSPSRGHRL